MSAMSAIQAPENISEQIKKFIFSTSEKEINVMVKIYEYCDLINLEKFTKKLWQNYIAWFKQVIGSIHILDKEAKERLAK